MTAPPLVVHEDDHVLVINKPAGWNTHAPAPYAGAGVYDWLREREPRWAQLAIIHRLDRETSGVMVFAKTPTANRSLTRQFERREVCKEYLLLTDRSSPAQPATVCSWLMRQGARYASVARQTGARRAETEFVPVSASGPWVCVRATPRTGRTHQIRVQAAEAGFPVLGDELYGGSPFGRVCLHAAVLAFEHPGSGARVRFEVPADFETEKWWLLRKAVVEPDATDAFRLIHGAADGYPGWYVDKLGDYVLSQSEGPLDAARLEWLEQWARRLSIGGVYDQRWRRALQGVPAFEMSPRLIFGEPAPAAFPVLENGVRYWLSLVEGYSVGLFLDQRDNRRRLLTQHAAAGFPLLPVGAREPEVLNVFAYTCGFSVCAARAGARVTSIDLSRKCLDWGRRNFQLNRVDDTAHVFLSGDALDWLRRLAKKGRVFDLIILDPPTFSTSKVSGRFQAARDYGKLVRAAAPLLGRGGVLCACCNAARLPAEEFVEDVRGALTAAGRRVVIEHYAPQPPDHPVSPAEPAYLKTVWLRVS